MRGEGGLQCSAGVGATRRVCGGVASISDLGSTMAVGKHGAIAKRR